MNKKQNIRNTIKCFRTNAIDQVNYFVGVTLRNGHFFAFFMNDKGDYLNPISWQIWGQMKRDAENAGKEPSILSEELEKKAVAYAIKTETAVRQGFSPKTYILEPESLDYSKGNQKSSAIYNEAMNKSYGVKSKSSSYKIGSTETGKKLGEMLKN